MIGGSTLRVAAPLPVLLVATGLAFAGEQAPPLEPGVRFERASGWARLDAVLPGKLVSYAVPSTANGRRDIVLLVAPPARAASVEAAPQTPVESDPASDERTLPACPLDAAAETRPLALYRLDPTEAGGLERLSERIPHDITAVDVADIDEDGVDEILLARPGAVFRFDPNGTPETNGLELLLEQPDLRWKILDPRVVRTPELDGWPVFRIYGLGSLSLYGPDESRQSWIELARVDLPIDGDVSDNGLSVSSVVPSFIGRRADGTLLFGTPAVSHGSRRIQTNLIEISTSGKASVTDCWGRLPEPEQILGRSLLMIDDRAVVLVTTKPANKLNLFGEKRLRIYPMERDRSRLGLDPLFATKTRMNLWQEGTPMLVDVNADGIEDLVIGYWKGLKDDRVVLDAYLRDADGHFEESERSTGFDVKNGDRDFLEYGRDITGDDLPDLLVRNGEQLLLHPGLRSTDGKKLVDLRPDPIPLGEFSQLPGHTVVSVSNDGVSSWQEVPAGQRPRFVDLDGDDHPELLFVKSAAGDGLGVFRVLWVGAPDN